MEVEEEEEEGTLVSPPLACVLASSFGEAEVRRPDAPRREADVELGVSFWAATGTRCTVGRAILGRG